MQLWSTSPNGAHPEDATMLEQRRIFPPLRSEGIYVGSVDVLAVMQPPNQKNRISFGEYTVRRDQVVDDRTAAS
jgi:hypothetical protein